MVLRLFAAAGLAAFAIAAVLGSGTSTAQANTYVETLSAGGNHTCAVAEGGAVVCWGNDQFGQASPPAGRFTQVSAGAFHTCAIAEGGTAVCWGDNQFGQASPPAGRFTQVSAGGAHSCGITSNGLVVCWGNDQYGQASAPDGQFTQVSAGNTHSCGVMDSGIAVCWGSHLAEDGTTSEAGSPAGRFTQVSADGAHSCGITSNGLVVCWGHDQYGQTSAPDGRFTQVSVRAYHSCAVAEDGAMVCWGSNLVDPANGTFSKAISVSGSYTQVSAGWFHNCGAKTDSRVVCWGWSDQDWGQSNPPAGLKVHVSETPSEDGADEAASDESSTSEPDSGDGVDEDSAASEPDSGDGVDDAAEEASVIEIRVVARRLSDGRTEFGVQTEDGERILPRSRFFPANATVDRWLRSSPVSVDGEEIGRINARLLDNGRIEFAFTPTDGERILPSSRFFPTGATIDRWLRSTPIEVEAGD